MSTETETPKKSILTRAMEAASDNRDKEWIELDTEGNPIEKKPTYKRFAIGVGATVVGAAAIITALKLFTGQTIEEETTEESSSED